MTIKAIGTATQEQMAAARGDPSSVDPAPIPRITIGAFCDTPQVVGTVELAAGERRMSRADVKVHIGGIAAALEAYRQTPTPNLIIVESRLAGDQLTSQLQGLAEVCDATTKVMVIGHTNDVSFYRSLLHMGVSEYVVSPVAPAELIAAIGNIYRREAEAEKLGQVYAFVGAKGGAGSSTIAHNVAAMMGRLFNSDVILADLDLPFGTAGLDFNLDTAQGIAEAVNDIERLDEVLLDRLLVKCEEHLSLLGAPAMLDKSYDLDESIFDRLLDVAQSSVPTVVLDVPHLWTSWSRKLLITAEEVVITAVPDLASLRNAKRMVELLTRARPSDAPPKLVINQVGVPKRPEIKVKDFAAAVELEPIATIAFDPSLFCGAANNGQMIADKSARASAVFGNLAQVLTGRKAQRRRRRWGGLGFLPALRSKRK